MNVLARCRATIVVSRRLFSQQTEGEKQIVSLLTQKFKDSRIDIQDISGGCGSMYELYIEAEEFRGKKAVAQHKMVNEVLKDVIKKIHGIRINTSVPDNKTR